MPAITNGAELVRRLKETGTPDAKLAAARQLLAERREADGRIASAGEVADAIEATYGPDHQTTMKARQLAATGSWTPPAVAAAPVAVEDLILGGDTRAAMPIPAAATAADAKALLARLDQLERDGRAHADETAALRAAAEEHRQRADRVEQELAAAKAAAADRLAEDKGDQAAETVGDAAKPGAAPKADGRRR